MIIGIGLDLVDVGRIDTAAQRLDGRFLERVFTAEEIAYCSEKKTAALHFAGRFAAKEACAKALGCGIGAQAGFQEMEVVRDAAGKPGLKLCGAAAKHAEALGVTRIFLTITHTDDKAAAVVVLEG